MEFAHKISEEGSEISPAYLAFKPDQLQEDELIAVESARAPETLRSAYREHLVIAAILQRAAELEAGDESLQIMNQDAQDRLRGFRDHHNI